MWQPSWACPTDGYFYPPTLFTDVSPVGDHRAGRDLRAGARGDDVPHARAKRWRWRTTRPTASPRASGRENINLALDIAPEDQGGRRVDQLARTCSTRPPGSAATARSGFGREGGREGHVGVPEAACGVADRRSRRREQRQPRARARHRCRSRRSRRRSATSRPSTARPSCSSAASRRDPIRATRAGSLGPDGAALGEVGEGNRKDIRNAVEAAHAAAEAGARRRAHQPRADPLLHRREPLGAADEFAAPHRRHDRAASEAPRARGRGVDRAAVHLRRVGRQVRRRRAPACRSAAWRSR